MSLQLNPEVAFDIALYKLNKKQKEEVEAIFTSLIGADQVRMTQLQKMIWEKFSEQDKYAVYQILQFDSSMRFDELMQRAYNLSPLISFISSPSRTEVSFEIVENGRDSFLINLAKHHIVEVYEDRILEGGVIETTRKSENDLLFFEAEYIKLQNKNIAILKFPKFRKEPNRPYDFNSEIDWFTNWNVDTFNIQMAIFDLKGFFESLSSKSFDKYGYEVSGVKGEDGKTFGSDFKIQFPYIKGQSISSSSEMFKIIDKVVLPELIESLSDSYEAHLKVKNRENVEEIIKDFGEFFEQRGISEEFFSLLHQACTHGIGHVRFCKDKKYCRYNLEYTRSNYGLIRVSHNGYEAFEPLLTEIKKYLGG